MLQQGVDRVIGLELADDDILQEFRREGDGVGGKVSGDSRAEIPSDLPKISVDREEGVARPENEGLSKTTYLAYDFNVAPLCERLEKIVSLWK